MKCRFLLLLSLSFVAAGAQANDSAVEGVGGSLRPLEGEHRQVRMVRETVRLDVYRAHYDVVARFVFKNEGPATVAGMGFPENAAGDAAVVKERSGFRGFRTTVDGAVVEARRVLLKKKQSNKNYALWVKRVPFARGQTRIVEVRYSSRPGRGILMLAGDQGERRSAPYSFTGGNWLGKVTQSDLICTSHLEGAYVAQASFGGKPLPVRRSGNVYSFTWRDWEAEGGFSYQWFTTLPGWLEVNAGEKEEMASWAAGANWVDAPGARPETIAREELDIRPAALLYRGIAWIALTDLRDMLQSQSIRSGRRDTVVVTGGRHDLYVLRLNKRSLTFKRGLNVFVDSAQQRPVELAAASQIYGGTLYVPAREVARALGGSVTLAAPRTGRPRSLKVRIPPFWYDARAIPA